MILENEKNDPIELERKLLLLGNISEMFTTGLFIINAFLKKIEFNHKKFQKLKKMNSQIKNNHNKYLDIINLIQNEIKDIDSYLNIIDTIITTIELKENFNQEFLENAETKLIKLINTISKINNKKEIQYIRYFTPQIVF
ncbi:MAG: hypothetical protein ACTSWR_02495 [Candidatus Helarchaeota archaeon]